MRAPIVPGMPAWAWVPMAGVGLLGMLAGLAGLAFPGLLRSPWAVRGGAGLLFLVAAVQGLPLLAGVPTSDRDYFFRLAVVTAGLTVLPALVPGRTLLRGTYKARPWRLPLGLLVTGVGLAGTLMHAAWSPRGAVNPAVLAGTHLAEVRAVSARTDAGTPVPVFANPADTRDVSRLEDSFLKDSGLGRRVIRVGDPDPGSNGPGWVFAGGRYHVTRAAAEVIVRENGYAPVPEPRPGDLVVYRDGGGAITHVGLVQAVGEGGFVMVESKWEVLGRHLHRPEDQPFGGGPGYYRSPRDGHLLKGLPAAEGQPWGGR